MKLIRTRVAPSSSIEKKQRLKSPTTAAQQSRPTIETRNKIGQARQQSLNLSNNQFMKSPTASGSSTKNQQSSYRQKQDHFVFSASSPPVQINKQAIMMGQRQEPQVPARGQKESLGHITASRRQKQTGLQINVEGCQSIVINSPIRGHVQGSHISSPVANSMNIPDNRLFYGQNTLGQPPQTTMSSVKRATQLHEQQMALSGVQVLEQSQKQQSQLSKKHLRQRGHGSTETGQQQYDTLKNKQPQGAKKQSQQLGLGSYQVTPKGNGHHFDQLAPRSTKARQSHHLVKGQFIDPMSQQQQPQQPKKETKGQLYSPQSTANNSLEQARLLTKGFSPRRNESNQIDDPTSMLFLQNPASPTTNQRRTNNRLQSGTTTNSRPGAHSSYNNRAKGGNSKLKQQTVNNSSLGFKTTQGPGPQGMATTGPLTSNNTLKIQNMRVYNETSAALPVTKNSMTTKTETRQQAAMRNNFISPASYIENRTYVGVDNRLSEQQRTRQGGSHLRHFSNTSSVSNTNLMSSQSKQKQQATKKRKLTLNQRASINQSYSGGNNGNGGASVVSPGNVGSSMRPLSGNVANKNTRHGYSLKTNTAYAAALNGNQNQQHQPQSKPAQPFGKGIQILGQDSHNFEIEKSRVYNPNAAMHGQRDITQDLNNTTVPMFYPSTTTASQAPKQFQFTEPSVASGSTVIATQQHHQRRGSKQQQNSSSFLIEEPGLVMGTVNQQLHKSLIEEKQSTSFNGLGSVGRRQSRQNQNDSRMVIEDVGISSTGSQGMKTQSASQMAKLNSFDSSASQVNKKPSRQSIASASDPPPQLIINSMPDLSLQTQSQAHQGPLMIPSFQIQLPQTTTNSTAPKISNTESMLIDLDPISKQSKDINLKIQQRKIESARRQDQPKPNLQVVVTHEINPATVGLPTGPQVVQGISHTTTNANSNKVTIVPSLQFHQQSSPSNQQQQQVNRQQIVSDSGRPSHIAAPVQQQQVVQQQQQPASSRRGANGPNSGSNTQRTTKSSNTTKQLQQQLSKQQQSNVEIGQTRNSTSKGALLLNNPSNATSRSNIHTKNESSTNLYNNHSALKFPITPAKCLKLFGTRHLTEYERSEILDFPQVYYFGEGVKKIQASKPPVQQTQPQYGHRESSKNRAANNAEEEDTNCGYDDSKGNYRIMMKDHIAYRYELVEHLGRGSFGVAVKCFDHKTQEYVAVKIIKNKKKYYYQAGVELKILQFLKENDPDDTMNIIHMKDYVIFRKHLCITFELMSINLYEFLKLNDFEGLSLSLVRRFAIQLLYSLKFLKENDVIHCDLKPENILLKDPSKSGIKIIDFGSSCFQDERVYTYIQSRFYRAPEIILGIPYTPCIDMWSFGCIMAEFAMGYPIFPGEDETDQISLIQEVCGIPPPEVLSKGQRKTKFFNESNMPKLVPNSHGKVRKPGTKVLEDILECSDQSFVNFVERCLEWDPDKRMTPEEAIRHQWILEGLPPKVLVHHQKLHNIATGSLPKHIREQREEYLATQPLDVQLEFRDEDEDVAESNGGTSYRNRQGKHGKSKSVDRTASSKTNNTCNGPTNGSKIAGSSQNHQAQQSSNRNHRASHSFDTQNGYRNQNVTANANSHNAPLRTKKQQPANQGKHSNVEQMLHASQQQR